MINRHTLLAAVCVFLMSTLVACGSSPPARLYLVEPVATPDSVSEAAQLTVLVDEVVLPEYLTRKEILSRDKDYVVSAATFDRWAEPLEATVTSTLAENLSALLNSDRVIAYPWAFEEPGEFRVSVKILAFGPAPSGDVELRALWRISGASDKSMVLRRSDFAEKRDSTDPAETVGAMSRALGELSSEIATALVSASATESRAQ